MSSEHKLTRWLPGHVKPVRKGIYERQLPSGPGYAYWTGGYWCWFSSRIEYVKRRGKSGMQNEWQWRGLASDPKESA